MPSPRAVLGPSPASTARRPSPPWGRAGVWVPVDEQELWGQKVGKNGCLAFSTSTAEVLFHPEGSRTVLLMQGSVS